jgi:hypothetical protein
LNFGETPNLTLNDVILMIFFLKKKRTTQRVVWLLFIVFFFDPEKAAHVTYFAGAFNASNIHQI